MLTSLSLKNQLKATYAPLHAHIYIDKNLLPPTAGAKFTFKDIICEYQINAMGSFHVEKKNEIFRKFAFLQICWSSANSWQKYTIIKYKKINGDGITIS